MSTQSSNMPEIGPVPRVRSREARSKPFGLEFHSRFGSWTYCRWYETAKDRDKAGAIHRRAKILDRPLYRAVLDVMR